MTKAAPIKPTAQLVVQIRSEGAVWANPVSMAQRVLEFHELVALSELDRGEWSGLEPLVEHVAEKAAVKPGQVRSFLKRGEQTGRLAHFEPRQTERKFKAFQPHGDAPALEQQRPLALKLPLPVMLYRGLFYVLSHDGEEVARMDAGDLWLLSQLSRPETLSRFIAAHSGDDPLEKSVAVENQRPQGVVQRLKGLVSNPSPQATDTDASNLVLPNGETVAVERFTQVVTRLLAAGLLEVLKQEQVAGSDHVRLASREAMSSNVFAAEARRQDAEEQQRQQETGKVRTPIFPVYESEGIPTALGMIYAYALAHKGGELEQSFQFRRDWVWSEERLQQYTQRPAVYLFSNYLWSHEAHLEISRKVKELSPDSITIHGGPDTPKYEADARRYLEKYEHVDIIVRGEGEASATATLEQLAITLDKGERDLSVLQDVEGITYRHNGEIIRNPNRDRIKDLNSIPSPFLSGLFDAFKGIPRLHVTLETNRGCPYGCTFCDWGSATSSKIRKFDMERVLAELEWVSEAKVQSLALGDANFGVFERDITVAETVARLKLDNGYPETFNTSYAKNSTKYLQTIVRVMADAGILAQGVLSLQTTDADTLNVINRSNIKVEQYNALASEMRSANLPLTVELMMGLPGATMEAFLDDLQQCINRDIPARVNTTTLLINSPMNAPEYRKANALETNSEVEPGKMALLVSSSTYTREEYARMLELRKLYMLFDNFGVLRLCSRFIRHRTGMGEMSFYQRLLELSERPGGSPWPVLEVLVQRGPELMTAPYSWRLMLDELKEFIVAEIGLPDDSALATILTAQHALLPAHGRHYPLELDLQHDVVSWFGHMLQAKVAGHLDDWPEVVPDLASFGPGTLTIDDPHQGVTRMLGCDIEMSSYGVNWDLDSGLGRVRVAQDFAPVWESEERQVI